MFFSDNEGERIQIPLKLAIIGLPANRHLFNAGLVFQRIWNSIANFVIFRGGGGGPDPCPPLESPMEQRVDITRFYGLYMYQQCKDLYEVAK